MMASSDPSSQVSLSLEDILRAFNSPINEEQAWALCYQLVSFALTNPLDKVDDPSTPADDIDEDTIHRLPAINNLKDVVILKDGSTKVIPSSTHQSTSQFLASVGCILFQALDYGLAEHEERRLEPSLEELIDSLTTVNQDADHSCDEGIDEEPDLSTSRLCHLSLKSVLEVTSKRLIRSPSKAQLSGHYQAVCRALVVEAEELIAFLTQVSRGSRQLNDVTDGRRMYNLRPTETISHPLDDLETVDWARLWMQVIRQLRAGVKLKKVDLKSLPIEFELTPYEMLLNDIRDQNYKLRHVTPNQDILQRVKKDAHELILDFIRSRPPLVPVGERKRSIKFLEPKNEMTLHDQLMRSIKKEHRLRPAPKLATFRTSHGIVLGRVVSSEEKRRRPSDITLPTTRRRLIRADLDVKLSPDESDLDGQKNFVSVTHDDPTSQPPSNDVKGGGRFGRLRGLARFLSFRSTGSSGGNSQKSDLKSTEDDSTGSSSASSSVAEDLNQVANEVTVTDLDVDDDERNCLSDTWTTPGHDRRGQDDGNFLSLTLDEVRHIRSATTKAEMESLGVTPTLKDDLEKGRVCFTCLKTRFGSLFGPYKVTCRLCDRTICEKCATNFYIPTDCLVQVPVYMLSPASAPLDVTSGNRSPSPMSSRHYTRRVSVTSDRNGGHSSKLCNDCRLLVDHLLDMEMDGREPEEVTSTSSYFSRLDWRRQTK